MWIIAMYIIVKGLILHISVNPAFIPVMLQSQLIVAVVGGLFRQVADHSPPIRSFSRTLTVVPEGSGFCIANEQLYITTATVEQIKVSPILFIN